MAATKIDYKRILLMAGIISFGLIIVTSLIVISRIFEENTQAVSFEEVSTAYGKLMEMYGENNFSPEDAVIQIIQKEINIYKDSKFFEEGLDGLNRYRPMIDDVLRKNDLDPYFLYIAFVESLYDPEAYNQKSGARGMWQLMPETAKSFGLRVGDLMDERTDPSKSTVAAARYLKYLQNFFGKDAFSLIVASYNAGEGTIQRSIKALSGSESTKDFWKLYQANLIPGQTKAFVIRVITFIILGEKLLEMQTAVG